MHQIQAQRDEERAVFERFLVLEPKFAGEVIAHWQVAESDPPDILCSTVSGRNVGVELGEWLHPEEMKAGKLREAINGQLLNAIGSPQPLNTSNHFEMVILHPKNRVRIDSVSAQAAFLGALLPLIAETDRRWPTEPSWKYAAGARIRDLAAWPPLGSYLKEVQFAPGDTKWEEGIDWILPPGHVDSFDDKTMTTPLLNLLSEKIDKYRKRPMETICDEYVLLLFFNQGVMYNSPIGTPRRLVQVMVADLRMELPANRGVFSKAYLFLAPSPGERAFRLW